MATTATAAATAAATEPPPHEFAVSPPQMLRRGLKLLGIETKVLNRRGKRANVTNFKAHYGIHPNQASTVWLDIVTEIPAEEVDLKAFFMALNFLRKYDYEDI